EPDDVAGLVDEMHEAREVGDRRRAVVTMGELERLEAAQVLAERGQDDGLLVHGWGGLPAGAGWPDWRVGVQGSLPRARAFDPMSFSAGTVDTPISRRMRSASDFSPPVRAAMAWTCAAPAPASARFMACPVRPARP